ncbi:MAG: hypothetical protein AABZ26_07110, partial [Chloroflexota bacterium]
MPPVFGPVSPSPTRLWSRAGGSATTVSPSTSVWSEASSPSRSSSSTTLPEPTAGLASAARASLRSRATTTPFPAARPSAFTTISGKSVFTGKACGPWRASSARAALAASGYARHAAVGTPASSMSSFANDLLHSMRPASRVGQTTAMPVRRSTSPTPAATRSSGPTMARSMCAAATCCSRRAVSVGGMS